MFDLHDAKPTCADARFGSFAFSIETGTPNTAAISSMISVRPARSFGGKPIGLRSTSDDIVRKRPVRFLPRNFSSIWTSSRSISFGSATPLNVSR